MNSKLTLSGGLQDSTNAVLDKFIPEIWGVALQDYFEKNLVFGSLANDLSGLVAGGGDMIHLPKHSEIVATDLYGGDNNALASSALSFTAGTTSEGEHTLSIDQSTMAAVAITDISRAQSSYDVMNIYTQKLGYALAKKVDFYLATKLYQAITYNDGANTNADGASRDNNITFTSTNSYNIATAGVANMIQAIYESDSSVEDYTLVLAPATYSSLFKLADFARYDGTGLAGDSNPLISGFAGKLGGVPVVISNNIVHAPAAVYAQSTAPKYNATDDGDETSELAGYLIHRDAMHIAYASGMKARVQSDYDLPTLSTRFVADSVYGCLITSDNSNNKKVWALKDGVS
tara:strand:+ start:154 stop:1191 length:1038 start_codon:yes stop_codon:yes gene_type:complete